MNGSSSIQIPRQAGIHVRREREAQGLTRVQLARKADVSERLLASLELGDATGIRLDKLLAVFHALGLTLAVQGGAGSKQTSENPSVSDAATAPAGPQAKAPSLGRVSNPAPAHASRKVQHNARPYHAKEPVTSEATIPTALSLDSFSSLYTELYRQIAREQGGSPETTVPGIPVESQSPDGPVATFVPGIPVGASALTSTPRTSTASPKHQEKE